mgnify:CR=1 FL=1
MARAWFVDKRYLSRPLLSRPAPAEPIRGCQAEGDYGNVICTLPLDHGPSGRIDRPDGSYEVWCGHRWAPVRDLQRLEDTHWAFHFLPNDILVAQQL